MARPKLPKELIKKYGISKTAWAVFRSRNSGRRVKKVRKVKMASRRRPAKRQSSKKVVHTGKRGRRGKGRKGGRKMGIPTIATMVVGANALRELGILDLLIKASGPGSNIIEEGATWAGNVKPGDLVDAFLPAVGLLIFRKFMPKGPKIGPIGTW